MDSLGLRVSTAGAIMDAEEVSCPAQGGSSLWPEAASEDIKKAQKQSGGNASFPALRQCRWSAICQKSRAEQG